MVYRLWSTVRCVLGSFTKNISIAIITMTDRRHPGRIIREQGERIDALEQRVARLEESWLRAIKAEAARVEALNEYRVGDGPLWQYRGGLMVAAELMGEATP